MEYLGLFWIFFILFCVILWLTKKIKFENVFRLSDVVSILAILVTACLSVWALYMNGEISNSQLTLETKTQDIVYFYSNNKETLKDKNHTITPLEKSLEIEIITGHLNWVYGVTSQGDLASLGGFDFDDEKSYSFALDLIKDYEYLLFTSNDNTVLVDKIIIYNNNIYAIDHNNIISKEYIQNFNDIVGTNLDFEKVNEEVKEIKQNFKVLIE
ncbi:hypothetical protein ACPDKE_000476 [Listeria monocytogenes]